MKRGDFLSHVGWTGAGIAYAMTAEGLLAGRALGAGPMADAPLFVQISDSHIGFHQAANPDVAATFRASIDAINALAQQPRFVVHTGDVTHLAKNEQFDTAKQLLGTLRARTVVLPGEHDTIGADPNVFYRHFAKPTGSAAWYSWDEAGIHFVALVNVFDFEKMGLLGSDQLAWLERDLRSVKTTVPVVVFAHVPLYALYPDWGWTTQDGAKALALLAPFERVTVLNGHIHQVITHVEGNIRFATAAATAYPQPAPGTVPKPGPLALPHDDLRSVKTTVPVVVFAHVPLYALYPDWGWTTQDGAKALALLAPFERVTVLNGHIHQVITHVEGNIRFATAAATAYPQPAPGTAPKPGPLALPHDDLLRAIGYRRVTVTDGVADLDDRRLG